MFEPLMIDDYFYYEEITVVFPVDNGKGAEVGTSKALLIQPDIAIIYDQGWATIDHVVPSRFFCGKYYEVADGYQYSIEEFTYRRESEILEKADVFIYNLLQEDAESKLLAG